MRRNVGQSFASHATAKEQLDARHMNTAVTGHLGYFLEQMLAGAKPVQTLTDDDIA